MDALRLRQIFERLDQALEHPTALLIRGGAAVLAHGSEERVTIDIDVLPTSTFVEADLRRACAVADLGYNPSDKDLTEQDYLEVVPEESLILPTPDPERSYDTVFRGVRLTVKTPPASDLIIGKLKRLEHEDLSDVSFLIERFRLTEADLREAFGRLPARFAADPVVQESSLRDRGPAVKVDAKPDTGILQRMLTELRSGSARGEAFWAQQLAFSPLVVWEVALAVRRGELDGEAQDQLRKLLPTALTLLGALPDGCAGDPHRFFVLARRQTRALAWGRRRHLVKLAKRLGLDLEPTYGPVPTRLLRPYPLIGWDARRGSPQRKRSRPSTSQRSPVEVASS